MGVKTGSRSSRLCVHLGVALLLAFALAGCSTTPLLYSPQKVDRLLAQNHDWKAAQAMAGINTGPRHARTQLVVVFDPNCPACAELFRNLEPYRDTLRIHWVPIGTTKPSISMNGNCSQVPASMDLATTLLSRMRSTAALKTNEEKYDSATCRGGYPSAQYASDWWATLAVRQNTEDMAKFKIPGTPTMLYSTPNGLGRHVGVIGAEKLAALINAIRAEPESAHTALPGSL